MVMMPTLQLLERDVTIASHGGRRGRSSGSKKVPQTEKTMSWYTLLYVCPGAWERRALKDLSCETSGLIIR